MPENEISTSAARLKIFSGIQPTGGFTLGNYIGAICNWDYLQSEYDCIYCVVDLHSLTVRGKAADLRRQIRESAAMLLACGIDPARSILFVQSAVPAHSELTWLLSCYTQFGELSRMTQFKDKSQTHADNINAGLFSYPVLMAADILLYDAALVPVGEDQRQHVELCRDIAMRFNSVHGNVFRLPKAYIPKTGARIMSLQQPEVKMSKSDPNENAKIMLTDSPEAIVRKFRRAVTDSGSEVRAANDKPGIVNLMAIYSSLTGRSFAAIEQEFSGKGYGDFKTAVGECVAAALAPIQNEYHRILDDRAYLDSVLSAGAQAAEHTATRVLSRVQRKLGIR